MMQCASSTHPQHFAYALLLDLLDEQINAVKGQFGTPADLGAGANKADLLQLARLPVCPSAANVALFLSRHLHSRLGVTAKVVQRFSQTNKRSIVRHSNQKSSYSARLGHGRIGYATLGMPAADGVARFNIEISQLPLADLFALSQTNSLGIRIARTVEKTIHSGLASTNLSHADCRLQITLASKASRLHLHRLQPRALGINSFLQSLPTLTEHQSLLCKTLPTYLKEKML